MKCDRCTNEATQLWIRQKLNLCEHCVDLDENSGRARGRVRDGNPKNQPATARADSMSAGRCVWCNSYAYPRYLWKGELIVACGWGHAGFWMDAQMEESLPIDEDYVRRSLGMVE